MYSEWLEVLQLSLLFRGIASEALNTMLECLQPRVRRCKQREIITVYGQPFSGIGIVASGSVSLNRDTHSGKRIILDILDPGEIFGEMVAFSDIKVWPVTVITQEDSSILFLPPDKIVGNCSNICASHSTLIMNMLNILSNKSLMLNRRIDILSAGNIRSRISSYLLDLQRQTGDSTVMMPLKRHELADYLNVPRPSLSREMGLMRDAGIIEFEGRLVTIKNPRLLEESIE